MKLDTLDILWNPISTNKVFFYHCGRISFIFKLTLCRMGFVITSSKKRAFSHCNSTINFCLKYKSSIYLHMNFLFMKFFFSSLKKFLLREIEINYIPTQQGNNLSYFRLVVYRCRHGLNGFIKTISPCSILWLLLICK